LKSKSHLKGIVVGQAMKGSVVVVFNIEDTLIPCECMFGVLYAQDMHYHYFDDLCLAISLGVKSYGFGEIGVQ